MSRYFSKLDWVPDGQGGLSLRLLATVVKQTKPKASKLPIHLPPPRPYLARAYRLREQQLEHKRMSAANLDVSSNEITEQDAERRQEQPSEPKCRGHVRPQIERMSVK